MQRIVVEAVSVSCHARKAIEARMKVMIKGGATRLADVPLLAVVDKASALPLPTEFEELPVGIEELERDEDTMTELVGRTEAAEVA